MKRCYVFLENCIIYGQVRKKQTVDYRQDNLRSANDLNMNLYFVYHRSVSLGKFFDQIFTFSVTDRNLDVVDAEYIIILNGFDVNRINEKSLMSADQTALKQCFLHLLRNDFHRKDLFCGVNGHSIAIEFNIHDIAICNGNQSALIFNILNV